MMTQPRGILACIEVNAAVDQVWAAWTTAQGIQQFFAPQCHVGYDVGAPYEILFDLDAPEGEQGSEGAIILALDEPHMLSFTWNAPPSLPDIRRQRTLVTIQLSQVNSHTTEVSLYHTGWGVSEQWDQAFHYFDYAWKKVVLPRLKYALEVNAIDWANPPAL